MSFWNDTNIATVERMWTAGHSATEIQREIGAATRNVVIGKVARMGMQRNPVSEDVLMARSLAKTAGEPIVRPPRPPRVKPEGALKRPSPNNFNFAKVNLERARLREPVELPRELPAEEIPESQRRTLQDLTDTTCRWPYGEPGKPDFFFCGAACPEDAPYCARHARAAGQR
jgi:GcrA cell cycle regulator